MSVTSTTPLAVVPGRRPLAALYMELSKARLSALVLFTTAAGFVLASPSAIEWTTLLWTVIGTALAAGSASAMNQLIETRRDVLMPRTAGRPLPTGAIGPMHAFVFAVTLGYAGVGLLALLVNLQAAGLALLTILLYVVAYTPLKPRTTLNTIVGAVCGAIPPMIGWVAAVDELSAGAWLLAALLFVWQLPHFMALAWLYREDYRAGGFRMLPIVDESGLITGRVAIVSSLTLILVALMCVLNGMAGWVFAAGGLAFGLMISIDSVQFCRTRSDAAARRLFRTSLVYLTAVIALMLIDRGPARGLALDMAAPAILTAAADTTSVRLP